MEKIRIWWEKRLCNFIGWDYNLLNECGEASHRQLRIYTCAILIIMAIWFTIGFVFSQRYLGVESIFGKILSGCAFMTIVYFVERIIILHMGGKGILWFRFALAILMAVLGAFIFDQLIFRHDLENEKEYMEEQKTRSLFEDNKKRDLDGIENDINSIRNEIKELNEEMKNNPTIPIITPVIIKEPDSTSPTGFREVVKQVTTTKESALKEQIADKNIQIKGLMYSKDTIRNRSYGHFKKEYELKNAKAGFLEELQISVQVIGKSWISILFYFILFLVLLCLELFVVSLKLFKTKECDYELTVKHQLEAKKIILENAKRSLHEKYVTKIIPQNETL